MMTVYVYVMDTLPDWEIGYVTAELYSKRFFKVDAPEVRVMTVGRTMKPVQTIPCGTMRLPLRPSTDWRGSPCGMRQSSGQRYQQGYDAAASRNLMLAPCVSPICSYCRKRYLHEDVR